MHTKQYCFTPDASDWGPYCDGRIVRTGTAWKTVPTWRDCRNAFGGVTPRRIGVFADARMVNGRLVEIGPWQERW